MKKIADVINGKESSSLTKTFSSILKPKKESSFRINLHSAKMDGYTKRTDSGIYIIRVTDESCWLEIKYLLALNNTFWWEKYGGEFGAILKSWRKENEKWIKSEKFFFTSINHLREKFPRKAFKQDIDRFQQQLKKVDDHPCDLIRIGVATNLGNRLKGGYLNSRGYPFTFAMFEFHRFIEMEFFPISNEGGLPARQFSKFTLEPLETKLVSTYFNVFDSPPLWNQKIG